jgi:hypothetical protein
VALGRGPAGHARGGGISDQCAAPGHEISHRGRHYTVQDDAPACTRPRKPVPVYVSGFAPQAAELAGLVGDGYRLALPDAGLVRAFRAAGAGHKPVPARMQVNWNADRDVGGGCAPPCGPPARRGRRPAPSELPGQLAPTAAKRLR